MLWKGLNHLHIKCLNFLELRQIIFQLILSFFLIGCGNDFDILIDQTNDSAAVRGIVDDFEYHLGRRVDTPITFGGNFIEDGDLGYCIKDETLGIKVIRLSSEVLKKDYLELRYTIFHELAHCELMLKHNFDLVLRKNNVINIKDNSTALSYLYYTPKSMMWPLFDKKIKDEYIKNKYYFENQLFNTGYIDDSILDVKQFNNLNKAIKLYSKPELVQNFSSDDN